MKHLISIFTLFLLVATLACKEKKPSAGNDPSQNAVYYWKTVFDLDSADLAFIRKHNIKRIYLRMFDVIDAPYSEAHDFNTIPNASVKISDSQFKLIQDSLSNIEFIPTVFITLPALRSVWNNQGPLAENIVERVKNMCSYNKLPNVSELQLDCDWTSSTEEYFFNLCDSVKHYIQLDSLPWQLSSTIRLHQLYQDAPPVDKGVLMVYNTGNFLDPDTKNSIINPLDVESYAAGMTAYPLHLDIAYPTYSWQLLFRDRQFIGLLNGVNLADTSLFTCRNNLYIAKKDFSHNDISIWEGDIIRAEESDPKGIMASKKLIERQLSNYPHSNILYHLDSKNLSKYTSDEINAIFSNAQ